MLSLSTPSDARLATIFARCANEPVHQVQHGGFATPPQGYRGTSYETIVGRDDVDFELGRALLMDWDQFPNLWVHAVCDGPTESSQQVAVVARCFGFFVTNVCRVASVNERNDENSASLSIVYTTVASHDLEGAEVFELIWDKSANEVTYRVASYSRPCSLIARMMSGYIRSLQRRFVFESCETVRRSIGLARTKHAANVSEPVA